MKVDVYNQKGEAIGATELPKSIFDVKMNADLVHQVFISHTANQRQNSAHTKNRGEVRGGGRKPWRQKGTGRARHGSTRSPIWVGGGVSGGPRNEKNWEREIPKKMKKKALLMVLSEKAKNNLLVILDDLQMEKPRTKEFAGLMNKLPAKSAKRLVLNSDGNNIFLSARNIAKTQVLETRNLNVVDLLNNKFVIVTKKGIKEIESTFGAKNSKTP